MPTALTRWMRDINHVGRRLRGDVAPPVMLFTRDASREAPVRPRVASVLAIERATSDAVTLRLRVDPVSFRAGQFLTLGVPVLGRVHRRNYSISCAEGRDLDELSITVKRVRSGVVSSYLVSHAKVGDCFEVSGPHGSFVRREDGRGPLVLIGAGSGITPLYSILRTALSRDPGADVALLYGNASRESTIFGAELGELARAHVGLTLLHAREDASPEAPPARVFHGRMDATVLARMLDAVPVAGDPGATFFLCGPEAVRRAARAALVARGVASARILEERYTTQTPEDAAYEPASVVFTTPGGKRVSLTLAAGETLLAGATRAGIAAPFSCAMGGCGDCRMRLVEGEVSLEEPNCLLPSERARGAVLGCVARARGACVVEVRA